jgi:hypothetical protein
MKVWRMFTKHPDSVGETYFEHQRHAFAFSATLLAAGAACLLHGLVPALFCTTGSRTVKRLYERMVVNRAGIAGRCASIKDSNASSLVVDSPSGPPSSPPSARCAKPCTMDQLASRKPRA